MTELEMFLTHRFRVNPNEKIDTSDDGYWYLKNLITVYIEEAGLVKNSSLASVIVPKGTLCDVCGSDDIIEAPSMGRNCNNCNPI